MSTQHPQYRETLNFDALEACSPEHFQEAIGAILDLDIWGVQLLEWREDDEGFRAEVVVQTRRGTFNLSVYSGWDDGDPWGLFCSPYVAVKVNGRIIEEDEFFSMLGI